MTAAIRLPRAAPPPTLPLPPLARRAGLALLSAVLACLAPAGAAANTVSGTLRYQNKIYNRSVGFTGGTELLPVRQADVEVVQGSTVLGTGTTDNTGAYAITIPDNGTQTIVVRVYARRTSAKIQAVVKTDNGATGAVYTAASTAAALDTSAPQTVNLDVTGATVAGAYNIFDVAVLHFQFLDSLQSLNTPPLLTLYWTSGSSNGTFFDPDTSSIFILGAASDTDEFDDDILAHELGHYAAAKFSKDDSPGGVHTITGHFDIRLAWSEGWAHFWSAALRQWANANVATAPQGTSGARYPDFIWQVDTHSGGFTAFELATPSFATQATGADNELSVSTVLWDAMAAAADGGTLGMGIAAVWTIVGQRLPARAEVSLEDFFDEWQVPANGFPDLTPVLAARTIRYSPDGLEANNAASAATPLDPLSGVGIAKTVAGNTFFPAGDQDWFSFTAEANATYKIETVNLGDGADTTLEVFDPNLNSTAFNDDRGPSDLSSLIQFRAATSGIHVVKVAPFSGVGQIVVYGAYDLRITVVSAGGGAGSGAPTAALTAIPTTGDAPLPVDFTLATSDAGGTIQRVEWDFDGDGVIDFTDAVSGTVRHVYPGPGSFTASVRVTDNTGAFAAASLVVDVAAPDAIAVTTAFSFTTPGASAAPASVDFSGGVSGGTVVLYEWDFDGDGVYDFLSTTGAAATHVYTAPGTFIPVLRVTDDRGRTFTSRSNDPKSVTIGPAASPPNVMLTTSPSPAGGTLPLLVTFTASSGFVRYEWDYDGDGRYDQATASAVTSYLYTQVGTFSPRVRATDAAGATAVATTGVSVTASGVSGRVVWPLTGQTVTGTQVSVVAEALPPGTAKTVQFQYRLSGGAYQDLGPTQTGTGTRFTTTWDTGAFPDPTAGVRLRVLVNGTAALAAEVSGLTISATSPTLSEGPDASGNRTAAVVVDRNATSAVVVGNDVTLTFPYGSLAGSGTTTVQATTLSSAFPANGAAAGMIQIGPAYDFRFTGTAPAVNGRFRLRIVVPDADADGFVDGTSVSKVQLAILWFDEAAGVWRRDLPSDVNFDGNWVETESWHFTAFGVFGRPNDSSSGGGHRCFAGGRETKRDGWKRGWMEGWGGLFAALGLAAAILAQGTRRPHRD